MSLEKTLKDAGYRPSSVDPRKAINNGGDSITKVGNQHYIYKGDHVYGDSTLNKKLNK
ncbi:hypothetical protein Q4E93_09970 [Flavitalea sp. BT771]|uniref:hypothetical protein n=1 Tax=Flavitalea sp. BT771 TaxID=3063329 RepID=UPI0026E44EB7|nr:hypothetical protein [Flavitalea sp. BT771]MDO6430914.1 hypothetical protein [Flavitalea sp. BT771]MDV6218946.1 hypothetical protein [Flavitalea sp. BT771]